MAAETPTGSTEGRALSAALSAPSPFAGRAASLALHASDRHVDRWAPERDAVRRSRSLGALSFVDRLLQPWMTASAGPMAMRPRTLEASAERAQAVSWVFPRPWYQDELDWMAAAREADHAPAAGALTTRGTHLRPGGPAMVSMPAGGDARQAVVVIADQIQRRGPVPAASLEYVAPSMGMQGQGTQAPVRALRAWSPQVSFAAAQAAEVMASTVAATGHAGLSAAQRSPLLEGLAYVTPEEIAGPEADRPLAGRLAHATGSRASAPGADDRSLAGRLAEVQLARSVAQLAAAQAVSRVAAPTAETSRAAIAEVTGSPDGSRISAPAEVAYQAEQARVLEAVQTPSAPSSFEALVQTAASSPAAAQAMRAVELFARAALTGSVAPASGPRVAMPAGLGGALIGFDAAETTRHAMVGITGSLERSMIAEAPSVAPTAPIAPVRGFAPVWAATSAATPALSAVASERPAAMTHLAWTDRWLARIAGASPASLSALDVAAEHRVPVPRALSIGAPEVVYILPELSAQAETRAPASSPSRPAGDRPVAGRPALRALPSVPTDAASRGEALRIADDEAVPDDVFAAIARAARPGMKRAPAAEAPRAPEIRAVAPEPVYVAKPTLADQIARTAPAAPAAGLHAGLASSPMAPALAGILPMQAAPMFDPRALFAGGLLSAYVGGAMDRGFHPALQAMFASAVPGAADGLAPLGVAARAPGVEYVAPDAPVAGEGAGPEAAPGSPAVPRLLSVHSPVLASARFVAPAVHEGAQAASPMAAYRAAATAPSYESPLTQVDAAAWSPRPGMTAELAQGFAIGHERSAADLAFDFVAPEQVLAARVYGFGAAEAAQAARLAVAGPAGLSAMASALDLTFLRQLHVASETAAAAPQRGAMPAPSAVAAAAPEMTPITAWPNAPEAPAAATGTVFGVERRLPRGAFLWPAGVVAALDLRAELPDGAAATNVAALELLAAGAVAQMGGRVAPHAGMHDDEAPAIGPALARTIPEMTLTAPSSGAAEPSTTEIAEAVAVPAPQRARFEAIYQTLSRSSIGQSLSPSVRAARALAIAAAQDGVSADGGSAQERARAAWSVMPAVYAGEGEAARSPERIAGSRIAPSGPELTLVSPSASFGDEGGTDEMRPGLSRLAARAGEAIGSFVRPSGAEVNQASSGAAHVAGGASDRGGGEPFVHELIRTGRGFSRSGGGETEIPAWFESAARKMLEQRGLGESLSVAELTLIASTPSTQVAASTRDAGGGPAPAMANAPPGQGGSEQGEAPNIEKIAADVYAEILKLIDIARERSGDPWL